MKLINIRVICKCEYDGNEGFNAYMAFCNVLYKMISKLLTNGLKCCLDKCISHAQSIFVEGITIFIVGISIFIVGKSIVDIALIFIEVIHALNRKTRGKGEK